jgi:hypothetical protein
LGVQEYVLKNVERRCGDNIESSEMNRPDLVYLLRSERRDKERTKKKKEK